jgi:peptidyl-prolyl cis-trans isomerase D
MLNFFRGGGVAKALVTAMVGGIIVVFLIEFRAGQGTTGSLKQQCAVDYAGTCLDSKDYFAALGLVVPRGMDPGAAKRMELRKVVLEGLAERELLAEAAQKLGLGVGAEAAEAELEAGRAHVSIPAANAAELSEQLLLCRVDPATRSCEAGAQRMVRYLRVRRTPNEPFDYKLYEREIRILANRGPKEFKASQQREMLAQLVRELVRSRVRVSAAEADFVAERAVVRSAVVSREWFAKYGIDTSTATVERWAFDNRNQVDQAWHAEQVNWTPGCPLVREVVIPVPPSAIEMDNSPNRQKAEQARARLAAGEDFASVARELSAGPSVALGGQLGCLSKAYGLGGEELLKAVQSLKPGEISSVIETPRGFHIAQVQGLLDAAKLEQTGRHHVALGLYSAFAADEAARKYALALVERVKGGQKLEDAVREQTDAVLAAVAKTAPAKPKAPAKAATPETPAALSDGDRPRFEISPPFGRSGNPLPDLEPKESITGKAFELASPDALYEKPIETTTGFVVVQLKERTQPEANEAAEVRAMLRSRKADEALTQYVAELRKAAGSKLKVDASFGEDRSKTADEE